MVKNSKLSRSCAVLRRNAGANGTGETERTSSRFELGGVNPDGGLADGDCVVGRKFGS